MAFDSIPTKLIEDIDSGVPGAVDSLTPEQTASLSDDELNTLIQLSQPEQKSELEGVGQAAGALGEGALEVAGTIGRAIDPIAAGPVRAGVHALQQGENPFSAASDAFLHYDTPAPTGQDIARQAGIPDTPFSELAPGAYSKTGDEWLKFKKGGFLDPSVSGFTGLLAEIVLDPLMYTPTIKAGAAAAKASDAGQAVAKGAASVGKSVAEAPGISHVGAAAKGIVSGAKEALHSFGDSLNTRYHPDYEKHIKTMQDLKLPVSEAPMSVQFGKQSIVSRLEAVADRRTRGGANKSSAEEFLNSTDHEFGDYAKAISGHPGKGAFEAGKDMIDAKKGSYNEMFNQHQERFSNALPPETPMTRSARLALDEVLEKTFYRAKELQKSFTDAERAMGRQLEDAVVGATKASPTYGGLNKARRTAYLGAKQKSVVNQIDAEAMNDLARAIGEAQVATVREVAGDVTADNLEAFNRTFFNRAKDDEILRKAFDKAPEKVFTAAVTNGSSETIGALKRVLPESEFNKLKGSFLKTFETAEGSINYKGLKTKIARKDGIFKSLFSKDELIKLENAADLGMAQNRATIDMDSAPKLMDLLLGYSARPISAGAARYSKALADINKAKGANKVAKKAKPSKIKAGKKKVSEALRSNTAAKTTAVSTSAGKASDYKTLSKSDRDGSDGYAKLMKFDSKYDSAAWVDKLIKNKKLLNRASKLTPGSKGWKALIKDLDKLGVK